jgi:hypothetical protein
MTTTAVALANRLARRVARDAGTEVYPKDEYGPRVRNARESAEHGWMRNALATVTFEDSSIDLIRYTGMPEFQTEDLYFEAYSTYLVGVYHLR